MKTKLFTLALAALTIGLLGSCKKEDPKVSVTGVTLDKTELTLTVGDSDVKLTAIVLPENATDKTVSWSSDKTEVAIVDTEGNVHAVATGEATITVTTTDGNKTATCTVTVKAAVSEIDLKDHITYEQPDPAFSYPYYPSWSDNTGMLRILRDKGLKELGLQAGKSKIIFHKTPETKGQIQFCDPNWTALTTVADRDGGVETLEYVFDEAAIKCVTGETSDGWSETAFVLQGDGLEVTKITVLP